MIALVVRNLGPTIARNVQVTFSPSLPELSTEDRSLTLHLKNRYADTIPTFTPGMEFSNLWFVGRPDGQGTFHNTEPTPDKCTVKINYEATDKTSYVDEFFIDVDLIKAETYAESSTAPEARMKVMASSLTSIDRSLNALAKTFERAQANKPTRLPGLRRWFRRQRAKP
ncbi:hypothetical protein AB0M20_19160 [Actinoplanes sp. NPDC051633]|uniref:hypothetical protein n=1 Tax=Actinoplanes sp. NPDC051633 TaxID=3155670 RepID=UPI00343EF1BB